MTVRVSDVVRIGREPFDPAVVMDVFDDAQCDGIVALGEGRWHSSLIATYADGRLDSGEHAVQQRAIRSTEEFEPSRSQPDVANLLIPAIVSINEQEFGYDVVTVPEAATVTVLRYDSARHDHFGLHRDLGPAHSTRKLSFSLQLTDGAVYSGGDLVFAGSGRRAPRDRGALTVFPAYVPHRVTTVVAGTRHALVGWIHGPAFR